jgi:hypothetical protein
VRHSPKITDVRLGRGEMAGLGRGVACRPRAGGGQAVFLVPAGGPSHEPDAAFVRELAVGLPPSVRLVERATHISTSMPG